MQLMRRRKIKYKGTNGHEVVVELIGLGLSFSQIILTILWKTGKFIINSSLPPEHIKKYGQPNPGTYASAVSRLKEKGFIKKTNRETFVLTPKGTKEALFAYINNETSNYKPSTGNWDGGWRIIFFDIPETKRRHRDFLRGVLRTIGFKEFQKSVWIYPHPVPSFLRDLLFEEGIKPYTRFITTEHIEYDNDLRNLFPETFFKNVK